MKNYARVVEDWRARAGLSPVKPRTSGRRASVINAWRRRVGLPELKKA